MKEYDITKFPLPGLDNNGSSMNNSVSEQEDEDDQTYYHEEIRDESEEECKDHDDVDEHDQTYYKDELRQVDDQDLEDKDLEPNQGLEDDQDEDETLYYTLGNQEDEDDEDTVDEYEEYTEEEIQVYYHPSRKKPKIIRDLDRISELSDDTIIHILSFLPMKDAVKTGTLSKRWQYLWTDSSILVFKNSSFDNDNITNFVDFVNSTLQLCTSRNIKLFELEFFYFNHAMSIDCWIRYLTLRKAEDVRLCFYRTDEDEYGVPQHLFNNSNLKNLSLSNCVFIPIGEICWRSLKKLSLDHLKLSNEVVSKILSGTQNLEILEIISCSNVSFLNIRSKSLKELVVKHCTFGSLVDWSDERVLEISAPHLKSLELFGRFYKRRCRLVNVASLVKVNLGFNCRFMTNYEERYNYMLGLLKKLQHVQELELGSWCTEVLSRNQLNPLDCLELRCKTLKLYTNLNNLDSYRTIKSLLYKSRRLETLKLDMTSNPIYILDKPTESYNEELSRKISFSHLKIVHITNFRLVDEEFVLQLVELILKNAKELEKMVIKTGNKGYYEWSSCRGSLRFVELVRKINSYQRCSHKAVVLIE